jgi:hypothetical protein
MKQKISFISLTLFIVLVSVLGTQTSCKKNNLKSGNLEFSADSVIFDTVFTTIGSTTKRFKFYNRGTKTMNFSSIKLSGGSASPFRINVDGTPGLEVNDIKLEGKDSLFVFVDVKLKVNNAANPLIIEDSIGFTLDGQTKYVNLAVWGQDAYFHYKDVNTGIWPNDKPHVVYGYAGIDENTSLTIQANTHVYLHKNSAIINYRGTLNIEGTLDNEVIFEGDRLEDFYKDVSGQWYGLRFIEAKPSSIDFAIIKNGTVGIQIDTTGATGALPTLKIKNTKIYNHAVYGIWANAGAKLYGENIVTNNCEVHSFFMFAGGSYEFLNCTFGNYTTVTRNTPAFRILNYYGYLGSTIARNIPVGIFTNCVIYGNSSDEFSLELNTSLASVNLLFSNCVIRNSEIGSGTSFSNIRWNQDPGFENTAENKFEFTNTSSPLNNFGISNGVLKDIKNSIRNTSTPDVGAYELL